jgi:hypothetical protein
MKHLGKIRWFDASSGEGFVRCNKTRRTYFVHFTAIEGVSKHNYHWPDAKDKERLSKLAVERPEVEFELVEFIDGFQVSKLWIREGA